MCDDTVHVQFCNWSVASDEISDFRSAFASNVVVCEANKITSIQPMSTLNEQGMFLLFDIVALKIIEKLGLSLEETKQFHANIE